MAYRISGHSGVVDTQSEAEAGLSGTFDINDILYCVDTENTVQYDGAVWNLWTGSGVNNVPNVQITVSSTEPTSPNVNDVWIEIP